MTSAVSCTSFFKFLQFVPFKPYFLHSVLDLSNTVVLLKFLLPAFVSSWQLASHNFIPFCCLCCCYLYHISLLLFHQFILSYKTLESYALLLFHSHLIQSNSLLLPFFALYKSWFFIFLCFLFISCPLHLPCFPLMQIHSHSYLSFIFALSALLRSPCLYFFLYSCVLPNIRCSHSSYECNVLCRMETELNLFLRWVRICHKAAMPK